MPVVTTSISCTIYKITYFPKFKEVTTSRDCDHAHLRDYLTISRKWCKVETLYNGRLIRNHVWPIEWHDCQWPKVRLKVTVAVLNFRITVRHSGNSVF